VGSIHLDLGNEFDIDNQTQGEEHQPDDGKPDAGLCLYADHVLADAKSHGLTSSGRRESVSGIKFGDDKFKTAAFAKSKRVVSCLPEHACS
jgi:hypothetical protein